MKKIKIILFICATCLALSSCYTTRTVYGLGGPVVIKDFSGKTLDSIPFAYEIEIKDNVLTYKEDPDESFVKGKLVQNCQVYSEDLQTVLKEVKEPDIVGNLLISTLALLLIGAVFLFQIL
ncbi:MAG: hypothetical protein IKH59_07930 [Bacteroidaceae bacterium]|nr:hypothetical protein [Bacteroidaceae bacterium]